MGTKVQTHEPIGVAFVIRNTSGSHQETAHFPSTHSVLKRRVYCVSRPPLSVVAAGMHAGWKERATVGRFLFLKRGERQVMKESWRDLPPTLAFLSQCASLLSDPGVPHIPLRSRVERPWGWAVVLDVSSSSSFWFYLLPPAGFPHNF